LLASLDTRASPVHAKRPDQESIGINTPSKSIQMQEKNEHPASVLCHFAQHYPFGKKNIPCVY